MNVCNSMHAWITAFIVVLMYSWSACKSLQRVSQNWTDWVRVLWVQAVGSVTIDFRFRFGYDLRFSFRA